MAEIRNGISIRDTTHSVQVASASLALDGGAVSDVFTISGGPILLLGLFTHVTTAVSNNACTFKWQSDPTSGASSTDLCGTVASIAQAAIGDVFYIDGVSANAQVKAANGTAVPLSCTSPPMVLPGGIDAVLQNSDPTTGDATVYLVYQPLKTFTLLSAISVGVGLLLGLRFLYFYVLGTGAGHIQSLILAAILLIVGFQVFILGLVADLLAANRRLLEDALYRVRKIELMSLSQVNVDADICRVDESQHQDDSRTRSVQ